MSAPSADPLRVALPDALARQVDRATPQLGAMLLRGPVGGWTWLLPAAGALAGAMGPPDTALPALLGGAAVALVVHLAAWVTRRAGAARDGRAPVVRGVARLADRCNAALPLARLADARAQAGLGPRADAIDGVYAVCRATAGLVQSVDRALHRQPPIGRGGRSAWSGAGGALSDHRHDLLRLVRRLDALTAALPQPVPEDGPVGGVVPFPGAPPP